MTYSGKQVVFSLALVLAGGLSGALIMRSAAEPPTSASLGIIDAGRFAGIDPSGRIDSDMGMRAFLRACLSGHGHDCIITPGTFHFANDLVLDFADNIDGGTHLHGAGQNATLFTFAAGKKMQIISSRGGGIFYAAFDNFGIVASNPDGAALQLGRSDFLDALNGFSFRDLFIKNIAATENSQGLTLNEVYSSAFSNITAGAGCEDPYGNCPSGGDALLLRQAAFNTIQGSFSGAKRGVHLSVGYNFGNVFTSLDEEVNYNDLVIDNPQSRFNTFIGGQWVWYAGAKNSAAILATAGASNILDNVNFSMPRPIASGVGVTVRGSNSFLEGTPPFPASGATITNNSGRLIDVQFLKLRRHTRVCYQQNASSCIDIDEPQASLTLPFQVGDTMSVTYAESGASWIWTEIR